LPVEEIARGLANMVAGEPLMAWIGHQYIHGRWLQDSPLKNSNMPPVHNLPPSRYYISSAAEGASMMYDRPTNQWYALKRAPSTLTQCFLDKLCDKLELYTGKPCLKVTPLFLEQALSYGVPYAVEYHLNRSLRYS